MQEMQRAEAILFIYEFVAPNQITSFAGQTSAMQAQIHLQPIQVLLATRVSPLEALALPPSKRKEQSRRMPTTRPEMLSIPCPIVINATIRHNRKRHVVSGLTGARTTAM